MLKLKFSNKKLIIILKVKILSFQLPFMKILLNRKITNVKLYNNVVNTYTKMSILKIKQG